MDKNYREMTDQELLDEYNRHGALARMTEENIQELMAKYGDHSPQAMTSKQYLARLSVKRSAMRKELDRRAGWQVD